MAADRFEPRYLIETPLDPAAGRRGAWPASSRSGTFARVAGETDELRARARATVESHRGTRSRRRAQPAQRAGSSAQGRDGPLAARARRHRLSGRQHRRQPADAGRDRRRQPLRPGRGHRPAARDAAAAGRVPRALRACRASASPARARADRRARRARWSAPSSSRTSASRAEETAALVGTAVRGRRRLHQGRRGLRRPRPCAAGRARAGRDGAWCARTSDRTGKHVMVAFNITDETDAMLRHADLVAREGGSCVMASLNWCGFSAHRRRCAAHTAARAARPSQRLRRAVARIRCSASASRPTRRCGGWPASTTCTCTACRASSRRPTRR